jgi:hypothetical protein
VRNRNGRVYPKTLLTREASSFYERHVRANRALGELDHPPPTSETFRCLNDANVSHHVLEYFWKGNDLMGYVEVLGTPAGNMLRDLYQHGFQLGMSSRGWATLKEHDGFIIIQNDFELITFDFVSDPSTEGAYLRPLQRRYEHAKPPIDVQETYLNFMKHTTAGVAFLKLREKKEKRKGSGFLDAPATSADHTHLSTPTHSPDGLDSEPIRMFAARVASVSGPSPRVTETVVNENSKRKGRDPRVGDVLGETGGWVQPVKSPAGSPDASHSENSCPTGSPTAQKTLLSRKLTAGRSNKVAPAETRPPTPLSLRDSWNKLNVGGGLGDAS